MYIHIYNIYVHICVYIYICMHTQQSIQSEQPSNCNTLQHSATRCNVDSKTVAAAATSAVSAAHMVAHVVINTQSVLPSNCKTL